MLLKFLLLFQLVVGFQGSQGSGNSDTKDGNIRMVQQNESRDPLVLHLLRTVNRQGEQMEKRDAVLVDLINTVKRQGDAIGKRDSILSGLLRQIRSTKITRKRSKVEPESNGLSLLSVERQLKKLSETTMHALNPYGKCNGGFRVRVPGTYIRYPASGTYPNQHANCEWNVEIPGNVTLVFTHFDMNRRKTNYKYDYVAVYEGSRQVGRWDTSSRPPGLLEIKGTAKITFHSRRDQSSAPGTGFGVYVDAAGDV